MTEIIINFPEGDYRPNRMLFRSERPFSEEVKVQMVIEATEMLATYAVNLGVSADEMGDIIADVVHFDHHVSH